ncbi:site-specific DNA-methyltransferase [Burkholderia cenocepacia]|uniref:site-specific DNA-methyltransferase n=1 Tax=Burkholderia cenocepacia TaxID=95486 RepID=UPI001CF48389|nr:site-specific DNA-methyltransferase [Burkholderia cenocepacia]MCA7967347.1 site-specific DNA-methyltransferase [Burkholderia cenocepacia]
MNETSNGKAELLSRLRDLVPSAFLDGELDKNALLDALGLDDKLASAFAFTWPGIEIAREHARIPTTATLAPDVAASVNWTSAKDVLIEGDNLQVLKLLKNGYSRKVKLVYIDPPYNTGDTFTYNDDFAVPESRYLRETGQVDEQGNAMTSRIETGGRKHSPWLTMMFPRLVLARHLLRRDGMILVSIDNNEVHHLRLLLDATFGAENFVDMMTWQGGRKGDAKLTAGGQDYILVYARDKSFLKANDVRWRERKTGLEDVYAKERELLEEYGEDFEGAKVELRAWFDALPEGNPAKQHSHYDHIDAGGVWTSDNSSSPNYRENLVYDFKGYPPPENGWRYELATMEKLDADGKLLYPKGRATRIRIKKYLHDQEEWAPPSTFSKDRSGASSALNTLMGGKVFDDPKSTEVLARLFHAITDDGDLILDFFAGSGSTGQAVWEQNPKDGKVRHWVLVQAPELPNSEEESGKNALEAGYKTIFEITAERLRRVAASLSDAANEAALGFRVFRTRPTNLVVEKPIVATPDLTGQMYLDRVLNHAAGSPVAKGAKPEAVAWEIALKSTDTRLDAHEVAHKIDGVSVYEFTPANGESTAGRLLISLDAFTLTTADKLGLTDNDTLILRGDKIEDSVTLTLAPRLRSKLILLERVPREVSL